MLNVSGLVVTLSEPGRVLAVAAAVRAAGPFTLGEQLGPRLTLTLESPDASCSADWFDWLSRLDGVAKVDVAFVYFEEVGHE